MLPSRPRCAHSSRRKLSSSSSSQWKFKPRLEALEDRLAPATLMVLNTNDSGPGSLRQAIIDSNGSVGVADTIDFNIGAGGAQTLSPAAALPVITDPVTIDGTTQAGFSGSPLIELNGAGAGLANGLQITAGNSTVRGLKIDSFSANGIALGDATYLNVGGVDSGGGNVIEGNLILRNGYNGIDVGWSANNRIGGTTTAARNVISGNGFYGIYIYGAGAAENWVQGNYIGTDATGYLPLPNVWYGVNISDASYNHVDGNVISGNGDPTLPYDAGPMGITVGQFLGTCQYNTVTNNKVGVGPDGTTPVPNLQGMIVAGGAQFNTFEGNLVAHNIWQGVQIFCDVLPEPTPTSDNFIRNNQITGNGGNGVEIGGGPGVTFDYLYTIAFTTVPDKGAQHNYIQDNNISGNGGDGMVIDGIPTDGNLVYGNTIAHNAGPGIQVCGGAQQNQIGGAGSGQANSIHDNGGAGVTVRDLGYDFALGLGDAYIANNPRSAGFSTIVPTINNAIRGNSIYHNGGLAIDLNLTSDPASPTFGGDGVTLNDAGDGDSGPNNFQNFPVLSAAYAGAGTRAVGTINSTPNTTLTLDFYASDAPGPFGAGQGQRYLGSATITTDGVGNAAFDVTLGAPSLPGEIIGATATDATSSTSEFSQAITGQQVNAQLTLSGCVFKDVNNDGFFNDSDSGLAGVTVALFDESNLASPVATQTTDASGVYTFNVVVPPGSYRLVETPPADLLDGKETAGSLGGSVDNTQDSDIISGIVIAPANVTGTGYNFAEIAPSRIQGLVWQDSNDDGAVDFGEQAIAGVTIHLTGTDDRGHSFNLTMTTDGQGIYEFANLRPSGAGGYAVSEDQPTRFADGKEALGTVNGVLSGTVLNDLFSQIKLQLPGGDGVNYNFGERPPAGSTVNAGQTATIGFWQNSNGQNLIKSLKGGSTATQLGTWMAATFPHTYGVDAGANNLAGKTNAQVAAFYVSLFKRTSSVNGPPKLDAQALAVALAVYVTNQSLAGTTAASYGFQVTASGVGTATFDVGSDNRAAFGLSLTDSTVMTVMDILLAMDARTTNGLLYDTDGSGTISSYEKTLRVMANNVCTAINQAGGI